MCPLPALQLLLWHSALWAVQEATPLDPARNLPETFLLKCLEQVRKIQADVVVMQERLVSERGWHPGREGTHTCCPAGGCRGKRTEERAEGGEGGTGRDQEGLGAERHGDREGRWEKGSPERWGETGGENLLGTTLGWKWRTWREGKTSERWGEGETAWL